MHQIPHTNPASYCCIKSATTGRIYEHVHEYTISKNARQCPGTPASDLWVRHYMYESRAVSWAAIKPQRTLIITCWRRSDGTISLTGVEYLLRNILSKTHECLHSEIFLGVRNEVAMWTRQWRLASMQGLRQQSNLAASVDSRAMALSISVAERFVTHLPIQSPSHNTNM